MIPGLERSPGEGNGNPLQYSCLENAMDRGAWWATVQGVAKSQTRLSDSHTLCTALYSCWGASSQIVQWREPESGQQEAQVGQCWWPKQVTAPTDPQFEKWGWCPPLQGFPHSWGRGLLSVPAGWALKSYKRLGSYPVLALVFLLVCGDNGQGRRMMQVRGRSGVCWAGSS